MKRAPAIAEIADRALLALALLASGAAAVALALRRFLQMDEFVFVRSAWLVARGEVPYRDFFDHHTPLFYTLLAPVVGALPERAGTMIAMRIAVLPLLAALVAASWRLSRAWASPRAAAAATLLLVAYPAFVTRALEIRPDLLAAACFLGAAVCLARPGGAGAAFGAGLLVAAALLATQKSAHYLWGVALLGLWAPPREQDAAGARWRRRLAFLAGGSAPALVVLLVLGGLGALAPFWEQNVALALQWQLDATTGSVAGTLREAIAVWPLWALATAAGVVVAIVARARRSGPAIPAVELAIVAAALPATLSLFTLPFSWPYNLIPFFPALTPFAALAIDRAPARWSRLLVATLVLAAIAQEARWWRYEMARDSRSQLAHLEALLAATAPDDAVFDDNGGYLFRPAAYRYWYHSRAMRQLLREEMARDMVPAIEAAGAVAWIPDLRFDELPRNVIAWVATHFQRYRGPIQLWGVKLPPAGEGSAVELEVRMPRQGLYFLIGEGGQPLAGLRVAVDGTPRAEREPFVLAGGPHAVRVEGSGPRAYLLWLPRTGELWIPESGPHGPGFYPYFF